MWQHCPSKTAGGQCGTKTCVALHRHRGVTLQTYLSDELHKQQAFRLLFISIWQFKFTVFPICEIFKRVTPFHIPNKRPSKILDGLCCCIHTIVLMPYSQTVTCLVLRKKPKEQHYTNDRALQNYACA
jgi:hypothetical protein